MRSRWSDADAAALVRALPEAGEALALRVYTSRLIGADAELVLHGGGNTSVKSRGLDLLGSEIDVLHVKGSGWDLASIEPAGFAPLELGRLRRLRRLAELDDQQMMAELRSAQLDASAPSPSVETLLHAFLPHVVIDHSHADAILVLTDQPDAEARVRALFGERVGFVPYVMPGFALARRAAEVVEKSPEVEGLVLEKHGLFSFGATARESYERHVALVDAAEREIERALQAAPGLELDPRVPAPELADLAPRLRGALAERTDDPDRPHRRWILEFRTGPDILDFAGSELGRRLARTPPITPDHVIRTKGDWLVLPSPDPDTGELRAAVAGYREAYRAYFARQVEAQGVSRKPLDPTPRVVLAPGLGLFAVGETGAAARVAADLAEHNVRTKLRAARIGEYRGIGEGELFEMEYWVLEQAKLGKRSRPPLGGDVALVTGAAGAIGEGVARRLLGAGAHVVLLDRDRARLEALSARLAEPGRPAIEWWVCDVTDEASVYEGFARAAERFGGVDLVVVNAGVARAGALRDLELGAFREAIDVNLAGAFLTVREALRLMERQGTGGDVVLVSTKNVFAPGAEFGAYSASKAGAHQLARVAALEGAAIDVRVNLINADAVFGDATNPSGLWREVGPARAAARGLAEEELPAFYRERNLLRAEVRAEHVGNAVLFFATRQTPTTGAVLPVDGGLPDAFPR